MIHTRFTKKNKKRKPTKTKKKMRGGDLTPSGTSVRKTSNQPNKMTTPDFEAMLNRHEDRKKGYGNLLEEHKGYLTERDRDFLLKNWKNLPKEKRPSIIPKTPEPTIESLEQLIADKKNKIDNLKNDKKIIETELKTLNKTKTETIPEIADKKSKIGETLNETELDKLNKEKNEKVTKLETLNKEIDKKVTKLETLNKEIDKKVNELETLKN